MQKVVILTVGRLKEKACDALCAEYIKRIGAFARVEVRELPEAPLPADPSPAQIAMALAREARDFRRAIPAGAYTVALCVEGQGMDSPAFAAALEQARSPVLCFLIGGSHGLEEELKREAALRLSFSALTFPHQLFRVMLLEQIYRAYMIQQGRAYHK